ncbi:hypothetical protein [Desulfuribacillus alkaliarsenatis]|uniref:Uncharacterized protein n=1 Tax=Desulfuribacillus alkaliarsenatis TaxID=766136 RepID=A0A1E5G113_9FIRM|nr:hypothetical protein [Desulfuribacillus alkaliarsenatis]OEF96138.1 hypothetical protein BHF68_10425 [Desulfuribacillus alkaliarsenatis]
MKKGVLITATILLIILFSNAFTVRLDGLSAALANPLVPNDSTLVDQVDYSWCSLYILETDKGPITAISNKVIGILWKSTTSISYYSHDDPVKTLGGANWSSRGREATVFSVQVEDDNVSYIEVGSLDSRKRKEAVIGEPITFSWDKEIPFNELDAKALNDKGEILYEYRNSKIHHSSENIRWYSVEADN